MANNKLMAIETFIEILHYNEGSSIFIEASSDRWGFATEYKNSEVSILKDGFHITGWTRKEDSTDMDLGGEFSFKFENIKEIGYIPDERKIQRNLYFLSEDGFRFNLILDKGFVREV